MYSGQPDGPLQYKPALRKPERKGHQRTRDFDISSATQERCNPQLDRPRMQHVKLWSVRKGRYERCTIPCNVERLKRPQL